LPLADKEIGRTREEDMGVRGILSVMGLRKLWRGFC